MTSGLAIVNQGQAGLMLMLNIGGLSARRAILIFFFLITCIISTVTLFPQFSSYRYPVYERFLDVFYLFFLIFGTEKSLEKIPRISKFIFINFCIIFVSCVFAFNSFGLLYVLVEYRQYLIVFSSFVMLALMRRQLDAGAIVATLPVYFVFLIANTALGLYFGEYYRPGVFGENNYDIAYLGVVALAKFSLRGNMYEPLPMMLFFAFLSQSRTAIIVCSIYALLRIRNIKAAFVFFVVSVLAFYVLQTRIFVSDEQDVFEAVSQLDRIQMLLAYGEAVVTYPSFGFVGQAFSGIAFSSERMDFYLKTQLVSNLLEINTPSNFHGHALRGLVLLGPILYLGFLWSFLRQAKKNHEYQSMVLIVVIIFSTGITQSIFSHPFSGSLFALACLIGFSGRKNST